MSDIPITGANVVISSPAQQFTRTDQFQALFYGKIYIGQIDKDPTVAANQVQVFIEQEDNSLLPVKQPLRTNAAGFPVYNGKIVKFVTTSAHSMALYDQQDVLQNYYSNVLKYDPDQFAGSVGNPDGLKVIGRCVSVAQLRTITGIPKQWINVASYLEGKGVGGGFFYWVDDISRVDDGGVFFRAGTTGGWVRDLPYEDMLTIDHFGALPDGSNDASPAMLLMHKWSYTYQAKQGGSATYGPGVRLGPGVYSVSSIDLGTTEITSFKMRGPECNYGTQVRTRVKPLSANTTVPAFKFSARFMEIANINWFANNSTQPFLVNTVERGAYVHVNCFVFSNNNGIVFQMKDTIDTKFNEIYSFGGYNSFLKVTWSNGNPGVWDHPTAIEISNFNFTGIKGTNPVIDVIRAGQSIMRNGWFTQNYCAMDVSQGGWLFDTVIQEASDVANKGQYAKIQFIGCRFAQGATWDWDASGYDPSMDAVSAGGSGRIPSWVTNGYDQGRMNLDLAGISHRNGIATGFNYSDNRMINTDGAPKWFNVGRIALNALGYQCKMRFIGAAGWDSTSGVNDRPGGTLFGGGEAILTTSAKLPTQQTTPVYEGHWYTQDNGPIMEIRMVHEWNYQYIYVRLKAFARCAAVFMETSDVSRLTSGTPFFFSPSLTAMTDAEIAAVANQYKVPRKWSINGGDYDSNGLSMNIEDGDLLIHQDVKQAAYGQDYLSAMINGQRRYIPALVDTLGVKFPLIAKADLATKNVNTYVGHIVMVSDANGTPYGRNTVRLAYSDGWDWRYVDGQGVVPVA